jgi:hypothetical protein
MRSRRTELGLELRREIGVTHHGRFGNFNEKVIAPEGRARDSAHPQNGEQSHPIHAETQIRERLGYVRGKIFIEERSAKVMLWCPSKCGSSRN